MRYRPMAQGKVDRLQEQQWADLVSMQERQIELLELIVRSKT